MSKTQAGMFKGFMFRGWVMAAAFMLLVAGGARAADSLEIQKDGQRVTVSAPAALLKMIEACKYQRGWITPGFSIDWGDGQRDPDYFDADRQGQSCAHVRSHVYSVPGEYVIKARMYHLGPTDAPVTDWEGSFTASVAGGAPVGAAGIRILNIAQGAAYGYQGIPHVEWDVTTPEKADVTVELLTSDGSVVSRDTKTGIAYSGPGTSYLSQTEEAYDAALKAGKVPFVLRARLHSGDRVLAEALVRDLQVSAEMKTGMPGLQVTPLSGKAPLAVDLQYSYYHRECFSYRIDWGDGTPVVEAVQPMRIKEGCKLEPDVLKLQHVYARPGTYRVVARTNNISPFKALDDIVPYEAAEIVVTP